MSFSFGAGGTKAETLDSLGKLTDMSPDGQAVLDLVTKVIEDATAEGGFDGNPVRFTVSASGHTGPGQVPFLNISLTASYAQ